MGSHYVHILHTLIFILYWPEDGYTLPKHVATLTNNNCHFMANCCVYRLNITLLD
jgi:hypothetical protein